MSMSMKNHTQEAIRVYSSNAIHELTKLSNYLFEVSVELDTDSQEFKAVTADLKRIGQIIKQVKDLDINSNPFGLSNFPFCNIK